MRPEFLTGLKFSTHDAYILQTQEISSIKRSFEASAKATSLKLKAEECVL